MPNIWKTDDCPYCGQLRAWEPHTQEECMTNLMKRIKELEEMVYYLRENKVDKPKKVKK